MKKDALLTYISANSENGIQKISPAHWRAEIDEYPLTIIIPVDSRKPKEVRLFISPITYFSFYDSDSLDEFFSMVRKYGNYRRWIKKRKSKNLKIKHPI